MLLFVFTARCYASSVYAVIVCLPVTSLCFTKTDEPRIMQTMPYDSAGTLVFWRQRSQRNSIRVTPNGAPNRGGVGYNRRFSTNISLYLRISAR